MTGWLEPVAAPRGTPFGAAGHLWASGRHTGQDFLAPMGTPVHACAAGKVIYAGNTHGSYGIQVKLRHRSGLETWYCHLSAVSVKAGDVVGAGALLGDSGATGNVTGPHLHLEFRVNGVAVDPVPFLDGKKGDPPTVRTASGLIPPPSGAAAEAASTADARNASNKVDTAGGGSTGSTEGSADDTHAAILSGTYATAVSAVIVLGGFALVALGAYYAAVPVAKKAATTAASLTPEGAAAGALT